MISETMLYIPMYQGFWKAAAALHQVQVEKEKNIVSGVM